MRHASALVSAAAIGVFLAQPAVALNPPANDQDLFQWTYALDMNTLDDTSDDFVSSDFIDFTGVLRTAGSCAGFDQPVNQPKAPEGCGTFTGLGAELGFWLYYDGDSADAPPGGGNSGNAWWRNRIILRYWNDNLLYVGKYRSNPAHSTCYSTTACPAGSVKFCGELTAADDGVTWSTGTFEFCSQPQ